MAGYNNFFDISTRLVAACEAIPPATAQKIVDLAQANAPVRTGFMRDSIHTQPGDTAMSTNVVVEAYYGVYVEFGTRFMAAQPFFFPAVDAVGGEFEANMSDFEAALL